MLEKKCKQTLVEQLEFVLVQFHITNIKNYVKEADNLLVFYLKQTKQKA